MSRTSDTPTTGPGGPTIGIARAKLKIGLANLAYNMRRAVWLLGRAAPA